MTLLKKGLIDRGTAIVKLKGKEELLDEKVPIDEEELAKAGLDKDLIDAIRQLYKDGVLDRDTATRRLKGFEELLDLEDDDTYDGNYSSKPMSTKKLVGILLFILAGVFTGIFVLFYSGRF